MPEYCDLCDLAFDQCVHGRPEPVVVPKAAELKKPPAPRRAKPTQPRVETRRVPTAQRTATTAYRLAILEVMRDMGGRGEADEILAEVERRLAPRLRDGDYEEVQGEARWRRAARFERKGMVEAGLIEPVIERGVWQLTPSGLTEA
ncbi:winged helix-turn-helix domain-containing protein [Aeromicrobium sp. Leaf350]|uniref:winged helix-turn-helix domain-containing protein n=1 Tax=Aeromicrobium sp. Leaf350 TaxID=2876565 RepID=UPI001E593652|nr:winged helix-turn-helix domain-containing protein [Aeromicrobium sp. Leaf350]